MKFAILVQGAPFSSQSSHSALHFADAVLASGHEIYRVFFYGDGVQNGNELSAPPQDEWNVYDRWRRLHTEQGVELIVCVASSLRRGVMDATEADRYEKLHHNLGNAFEISGLGQLIDASLNADRVVEFGV